MESKLSQLYNKKEKERKGGGRREERRKIMVFLEVTKPTLIRPFLAKEFSLFFKIYLFESEANYNAVVVFAILDMNLPRVYTCAPS